MAWSEKAFSYFYRAVLDNYSLQASIYDKSRVIYTFAMIIKVVQRLSCFALQRCSWLSDYMGHTQTITVISGLQAATFFTDFEHCSLFNAAANLCIIYIWMG